MKKKIISSVCLAFLLSTDVFGATSFNSIIDSAQTTGASTWTDDATGATYFSGGRISYRFKKSGTYPLWFNGDAPSISVGCNGFDLNGGFVSILGWDQMEEQLSEAGTSMLYGAVLIIASSTPILSDVIDKIQKWSRLLQQILQNSCEITKNIGRGYIRGKLNDDLENLIFDSADKNTYNESTTSPDEYSLKKLDDTLEGWYTSASGSVNDAITGEANKGLRMVGGVFDLPNDANSQPISTLSGVGSTSSILKENLMFKSDKNFILRSNALSLVDGSNSTLVDLANSGEKEKVKGLIVWSRLLFGDLVVSQSSVSSIADIATTTGGADQNKLAALAKALYTNPSSLKISPEFNYYSEAKDTDIVDIFLEGFVSSDGNLTGSRDFIMPDVIVYNIEKVQLNNQDSNTSGRKYTSGLFTLNTMQTSSVINFEWVGFEKVINEKLFNLVDPSAFPSVSVGSVNPLNPFIDVGGYVKQLRRYYSAGNSIYKSKASQKIKELGKAIAFYNAKALYMMIRNAIYKEMNANKQNTSFSTGGKTITWNKHVRDLDSSYLQAFNDYMEREKIISQRELEKEINDIKKLVDRELRQNTQ